MPENQVPREVDLIQEMIVLNATMCGAVDAWAAVASEYANSGYGTGGANAITDATVQTGNAAGNGPLPAATALQVAEAVGVMNGSGGVFALIGIGGTMRGYLDNLRQ